MSVADFGAPQWAGMLFGIVEPPANYYIALCTDEPGDGWDGNVLTSVEPADSAYARQPAATPAGWVLSDNGFVINAADLSFPTPLADWGYITHYALLDGSGTSANLYAFEAFIEAFYIPAGYDVTIPVGSLAFGVAAQLRSIAE